jgi:hypothetical protein
MKEIMVLQEIVQIKNAFLFIHVKTNLRTQYHKNVAYWLFAQIVSDVVPGWLAAAVQIWLFIRSDLLL